MWLPLREWKRVFWTSLPDACPTPKAQATGMCHLEMSKVPSNGVYVAELRDVSVSSAVSTHVSTTHIAKPLQWPLSHTYTQLGQRFRSTVDP